MKTISNEIFETKICVLTKAYNVSYRYDTFTSKPNIIKENVNNILKYDFTEELKTTYFSNIIYGAVLTMVKNSSNINFKMFTFENKIYFKFIYTNEFDNNIFNYFNINDNTYHIFEIQISDLDFIKIQNRHNTKLSNISYFFLHKQANTEKSDMWEYAEFNLTRKKASIKNKIESLSIDVSRISYIETYEFAFVCIETKDNVSIDANKNIHYDIIKILIPFLIDENLNNEKISNIKGKYGSLFKPISVEYWQSYIDTTMAKKIILYENNRNNSSIKRIVGFIA